MLDTYRWQMNDLSIFMKKLKGYFATDATSVTGPSGLSASRSVLLEGGPAVAAIAAYIDLYPVRAGLCEDPEDCRYCIYAEAIAKGGSDCR